MEVVGYKTHIAQKGETPDILALKYYSDEFMASYILESNVNYQDILILKAGKNINPRLRYFRK